MRKYKYDGKEYDFDSYKQGAIDDFDSWAQDLNLGKTQTDKIKTAMMELLQHMTDDDKSEATLTRINFGSNYANEKGLFGKNVKDSKHYRNAAAYLLKRFNNSNPYQEAKPAEPSKTKVTRQWVGQQLLDRMGNTTTYTDEQKRNAANKAFLGLSNMLSKTPDAYEFEQGYDLSYFTDLLNNGATAALSNDNFIDDNPYWGELGIANPFYKKAEEKTQKSTVAEQLKQTLISDYGITEEQADQFIPLIQNARLQQLLKQYSIDDSQIVGVSTKASEDAAEYGANSHNAGIIYNSGGITDFNQLPGVRRTYIQSIVPQLKQGTFSTGKIKYNNVDYNTIDFLTAATIQSIRTQDPQKRILDTYKVQRKGKNNGNLYILTKSYNPQNKTAVYYNDETGKFLRGKTENDIDFMQFIANPNSAHFLKEGGVLKMQYGGLTKADSIALGFTPDSTTTISSGVQYTIPEPEQKRQEEKKNNSTRASAAKLAQLVSLGTAGLSFIPAVGYPFAVASSLSGMAGTWLDPNLSLSQKLANTGVESLGLIPGGVYVKGFNKVSRLGRYIRRPQSFAEAEEAANKARKAQELASTEYNQANEAAKTASEAYQDLLTKKVGRKKLDKAFNEAEAAGNIRNEKFSDLDKANEKVTEALETKVNTPRVPLMARAIPNAIISGGMLYGAPAIVEEVKNHDNAYVGIGFGALKGGVNLLKDIYHTGSGDEAAIGRLGTLAYGTVMGGNGRMKSAFGKAEKLVGKKATATATAAAAATAASASPNKKETIEELRQIPVMADKILINPSLGEASPALVRGKDTSDENWRRIASVQRPTSGNGIYVYDKNNQQLILSAKDSKTYQLFTKDGNLIKEFPISDKSVTNHLYTKKDGWYGVTSSQFDRMPYLRNNGQFYKKGGKLNNLKNLRK